MIMLNTDWLLFFGRFHPLVVHLPIGIVLFLFVMESLAFFRNATFSAEVRRTGFAIGSLSSIVAVISGYFISSPGGYDRETLFWHKLMGTLLAVVMTLSWIVQSKALWDVRFSKFNVSTWLLFVSVALIMSGAHFGGKMTHGQGYLTKYMPPFLKKMFVTKDNLQAGTTMPSVPLDSLNFFSSVVQPILDKKCARCHNNEKAMGDLVLTSENGILKGGRIGKAIVKGDWQKSEILKRINLPETSERFMPLDNEEPLDAVEKTLLKSWIVMGADFRKNIAELETDERFRYLLSSYLGYAIETGTEAVLPAVPPADSLILKSLAESGVAVSPINTTSNLLDVSLSKFQKYTASEFLQVVRKLQPVRQQLYQLDVKNCQLNNEAAATISTFSLLHKLNMYNCGFNDEMSSALVNLKHLSVLNLARNGVTDESVKYLKEISSLKKIYLWETKITKKGIENLSGSNKELSIIAGIKNEQIK